MTHRRPRLPQRPRLRRPPPPARARPGRRATAGCSAVVPGRRPRRRTPRPATEVVDLAGGLLLPGFPDAHVHPVQGGLERLRCDLTELSHPRGVPRARSGRTPPRTRTVPWILGGGWAMAAFPGGTPTAADLDAVVAGPAGVPAQPRPPRRLGQHPRRCELAGIDARHPRPAGRPDRARRRRPPDRHPARGRDGAGRSGTARRPPTRSTTPALLAGQAYLHSLGVTAWQDAIVGAYAGMRRPGVDVPAARSTTAT